MCVDERVGCFLVPSFILCGWVGADKMTQESPLRNVCGVDQLGDLLHGVQTGGILHPGQASFSPQGRGATRKGCEERHRGLPWVCGVQSGGWMGERVDLGGGGGVVDGREGEEVVGMLGCWMGGRETHHFNPLSSTLHLVSQE